MPEFEKLTACLPQPPAWVWNWTGLRSCGLAPLFDRMAETPQHAPWHGEGDVYRHTVLVCEALARLPAFRALDERRRQVLAVAALLHDEGKIRCTRQEYGVIDAPGHAASGAASVRRLLWQDFGLSGNAQLRAFREAVCLLIRHHSLPLHLLEREDNIRHIRRLAACGETAPDFSLEMLCLLAEADVRGRIADDCPALLDEIQLSAALAEEAGCLKSPYAFPSACTRRAYLSGRNVWPEQTLYDDAWGEVILMCGLPGTGKDTWIAENHPELPVVCMDDIRRQMNIAPTDEQGRVVQAAREQARVHLRAKQPFIWNATDITPLQRCKQVDLFEDYGASVRIVYLETSWAENLRRNAGRTRRVPENVIDRMLTKLIPPEPGEARHVDWINT